MSTSDELTSALRSRGLRVTQQREQVLEVVRRLGHATPEEIAAGADSVDVTTVYRTLQVLEDIGLVAHTHLGHGAPSYQPSDAGHVHVVCHGCGSVVTAPAGLAETIAVRLQAERDFTLDIAHLTIFGQCADCQRAGIGDAGSHAYRAHAHDRPAAPDQQPGPGHNHDHEHGPAAGEHGHDHDHEHGAGADGEQTGAHRR